MLKFPTCGFGIFWQYGEQVPFVRKRAESAQKHFFGKPFLGMGPGGTIINREFFLKTGGYPTKYGPANDMYFNLKMAAYTDIVLLPRCFSNYRIHEGQEINNRLAYLLNGYLYFKDALKELPLPLKKEQVAWLLKKGERRFVVNSVNYFMSTYDLKGVLGVYKKAGFSLGNLLTAIFQI